MRNSIKTKNMIYISLMTVMLVICAWLTIPLIIPITLQTFGVFCALLILGGKKGTLSILVYILLGVIGAPVFSGFCGGPGVIMGATGGYILGFLLIGVIYLIVTLPFENRRNKTTDRPSGTEEETDESGTGKGTDESGTGKGTHKIEKNIIIRLAALFIGLIVCYVFGTFWFVFVYSSGTGTIAFGTAFTTCVLPYIVPDIVKLVLAYILSRRVTALLGNI